MILKESSEMLETITPFKKITKSNVVEEIIEVFRQSFLNGDLKPGERLPSEDELARQFGVGRSAIREAMKMLAVLGVIKISRGNGTYVAEKPSDQLLNPLVFALLSDFSSSVDLFELRILVQSGYCQLAAEKVNEKDWENIEEAYKQWHEYSELPERDVEKLTEYDLKFHYEILNATHNSLVITVGRLVEELFFASIRKTLSSMEGIKRGQHGHESIINAIKNGDPNVIRQTVINSLSLWYEKLDKES